MSTDWPLAICMKSLNWRHNKFIGVKKKVIKFCVVKNQSHTYKSTESELRCAFSDVEINIPFYFKKKFAAIK